MEEKIKTIVEKVKKDKEVIAVVFFGSSLNKKGRDIDLCLILDRKYSNLDMSKKHLEFLKAASSKIDIGIFQQLPIYIRIRIIREGKILFCKNYDSLCDIAFSTIKEFGFYEKLYKMYLEEVKHGQRKSISKV